jgi:hypothetical protein
MLDVRKNRSILKNEIIARVTRASMELVVSCVSMKENSQLKPKLSYLL